MKIISLQLLIFCTLCLFQCCDKPDPKPDPCKAKKPISADFYIYEYPFAGYDRNEDIKKFPFFDTDTTITQFVKFVPKDTTAESYRWEIGNGVYTTTSVVLDFAVDDKPFTVPVKLTAIKRSDTTCFPEKKGTDIKLRTFLSKQDLNSSEVYGMYKGNRYGQGRIDTATLIIYRNVIGCPDDLPTDEKGWCNPYVSGYALIYNLYNNCKSYYVLGGASDTRMTNRVFYISGQNRETCRYFPSDLYAVLNENRKDIVITYNLRFDRETPTPFTFTGIKLNDL